MLISILLQVLANLCLKLTSKLGGISHVLAPQSRPDLLQVPVMIMGADVTLPASDHKVREQTRFNSSII